MPSKKKTGLGSTLNKQRNRDKMRFKNALSNDQNNVWVNQELGKKSAPVSVLETNALEEFLNNAILAEKDFAAHKRNAQIVDANEGVVSELTNYLRGDNQEKREAAEVENEHKLRIPRRPKWDSSTTAEELAANEKADFLEWRRSLAALERHENLLVSPFEKNLDVWRQLWRVIERSDVVVQIVDGRNPLMYRCQDLELYVDEVAARQGRPKKLMLLLNKADLLSVRARRRWAAYFAAKGVRTCFWSANYEKMTQEEKQEEMLRHMEEVAEMDRLEQEILDNDLLMEGGYGVGQAGGDARDDDDDDAGVVNAFGLLSMLDDSQSKGKLADDETAQDSAFLWQVHEDSEEGGSSRIEADEQGDFTREQEMDTHNTQDEDEDEDEEQDEDEPDDEEDEEEQEVDLDQLPPEHIYTREQLLALFDDMCEEMLKEKREAAAANESQNAGTSSEQHDEAVRAVVGMVGYPNVGKSSTINVLCHDKKVTVSSTPGKTKHFQTHVLSDDLMLCDCPGLVFPSFMANKSEMITAGVLPIDQMRDHYGPITLVCHRISRRTLEALYGIVLPKPSLDEDPKRPPTARELLQAYSTERGYMSGHGVPDESRGAREILKDYINGVLLYTHRPPALEGGSSSSSSSSSSTTSSSTSSEQQAQLDFVDEDDDDEEEPELNEAALELIRQKKEKIAARDAIRGHSVEKAPTLKAEETFEEKFVRETGKLPGAKKMDRRERKGNKKTKQRKAAKHGKKPGINTNEGVGIARAQHPHHRLYAAANQRLDARQARKQAQESE